MSIQPHSRSTIIQTTRAILRHGSICATLPSVLVVLAILSLVVHPASAAVTEAWVQRYSNVTLNANDQAFKVARDAAGDFMTVGMTDDGIGGPAVVIIKYSGANGAVLWQKSHYIPLSISGAAVDGSGNLLMAGTTFGDYYTAKYAAGDGALLWERRYNGPSGSDDNARAVAVDGDGNVVVTGSSKNGFDDEFTYYDSDYYTAKYAAEDGALLWEKRYHGGDDYATAVAVDGSGSVVVTGVSSSEFYTARYAAADGALLWEKRYHSPANYGDVAYAVALDDSGNVFVTGASYSTANSYDYYTAKYAAGSGALLWERRYNGPASGTDEPSALVVDSSGNAIVTGTSFEGNNLNYYTAKYAAVDGALLWEQRYNGPGNGYDKVQALAVDASGNVFVTGYSSNGSDTDGYTAKYAGSNGMLVWDMRYNNPTGSQDQGAALAVDALGNVVVTGSSAGGGDYDFYTVKYAAADSAVLWEKRFEGAVNRTDTAEAVAMDASGNVVVTGSSSNGHTIDYYTAKYAALDGTLLWERRHPDGVARAVAVDASGHVVVTGFSSNDIYTAKYATEDGTLLWEKRYNGPSNSFDQAHALAVDDEGNVLVTGSVDGESDAEGYLFSYTYTAKYAAADGALLWERRSRMAGYDSLRAMAIDADGNVAVTGIAGGGTAKYAALDGALLWETPGFSGYSAAVAVAVDSAGHVVVTETRYDASFNVDYYTAKYAAATGALLWEKTLNGPANGSDYASALAVDVRDDVIVTGSSARSFDGYGEATGFYTAKLAALDGALLWEQHGPIGNARAVAVEGNGNVVVAGSSSEAGSDYYTASYAAADGALLWEKRYDGPAHGDDTLSGARSLALGPHGMVAVAGSSDGDFRPFSRIDDAATVVYRKLPPPIGPELTLEQPIGTVLADGISSANFGGTALGSSREFTFTIRSEGQAALTGINLVMDGADASEFTVTAEPAAFIAGPEGTSQFKVRFTPASRTVKHAMLRLISNDADESPFEIALDGLGMNTPPIAGTDSATTPYRAAIDLEVLANDSDAQGDAVTIDELWNGAYGTTEIVTTITGPIIRYTPNVGFFGTDSFNYRINDGFGGVTYGVVNVTVDAPPELNYQTLYAKGQPVPGTDDPASGVPGGATWKTFGVPSISSDGQVSFMGTIATPGGTMAVVHLGSSGNAALPAPAEYLVAKQGDLAAGASGGTFASFHDPLLNNAGTVVFLAKTSGGSAGTHAGIWKHYDDQGIGAPTLVALSGTEPAGVPGARWQAFTSVALSDGLAGEELIAFTATMTTGAHGGPGPGGAKSTNDEGLWIARGSAPILALREGATVLLGTTTKKVRRFVALRAVPGAAGQGHGATGAGVLARVRFEDRTEAVLRVTVDQGGPQISALAVAGDAIAGLDLRVATFGVPTQSADHFAAFSATLSAVPRNGAAAIFQSDGFNLDLVARKGQPATADFSVFFRSFTSVVSDSAGRVAVTAQVTDFGTNGRNKAAIWLRDHNGPRLVAREGWQPPGVPDGARWAGFPSMALPDGFGGPIFVGELFVPAPGEPNPARITTANHLGIWAVDSTGNPRLIARTGEVVDAGRKVIALALLRTVRGSPTQTRSFNEAGDIIYRVTLNDGSQQVVNVRLP